MVLMGVCTHKTETFSTDIIMSNLINMHTILIAVPKWHETRENGFLCNTSEPSHVEGQNILKVCKCYIEVQIPKLCCSDILIWSIDEVFCKLTDMLYFRIQFVWKYNHLVLSRDHFSPVWNISCFNNSITHNLNEVIPLCINSIYLLYYTSPSTQHKSQSYHYMFRLNKSSSGVSKNQN